MRNLRHHAPWKGAARRGAGRFLVLVLVLVLLPPARSADALELSEAGRWLRDYLRIDTTNPPGNEHLGAAYLAGILHREGITTRLLVTPEGRASLYARLSSGKPGAGALLLAHHIDVVPAGDGWKVPPFAGEVRDGVLWGRGAVDIKSLGVAQLAAFIDLKRRGEPLERDVVYLAVADEENGGGRGTAWLLAAYPELFEDVWAVLNEGGSNRAINGRLLWWGVEVVQKRPLWLRVTAGGRGGHGSGLKPTSATHKLIRALDGLVERPLRFRVTDAARLYLGALAPLHNPKVRAVFEDLDAAIGAEGPRKTMMPGLLNLFVDSVQVTVLGAGDRINIISPVARAEVDVRLLPDTDAEAFLGELRRALGPEVEVEVLLISPPSPPSPSDHPLYRAIEEVWGASAPVVPAFIAGFTDSRYFRERGIPAYGVSPFALEPQTLLGIHAVDESIPLAEFDRGVERLRQLVRAAARRGE